MIAIANHTNCSITIDQYFSQFTGRHFQYRIFIFLIGQLCRCTCTANQFATLARLHFNIVNVGTEGIFFICSAFPISGATSSPAITVAANLQTLRSKDVSLFTISIIQQRDECGTVWIVLNRCNSCRYIFLISFEIDQYDTSSCFRHRYSALLFCPGRFGHRFSFTFQAELFSGVSLVISA